MKRSIPRPKPPHVGFGAVFPMLNDVDAGELLKIAADDTFVVAQLLSEGANRVGLVVFQVISTSKRRVRRGRWAGPEVRRTASGQNGSEGTQHHHASEPDVSGPLQPIPIRIGLLGICRAPLVLYPCTLRLSAAALAVNNLLPKTDMAR